MYLASLWSACQRTPKQTPKHSESAKKDNGKALEKARAGPDEETKGLKSLLTGLPSTTSKVATITTIGINVVLVLFTVDFVMRSSFLPTAGIVFSRVGYVSPTSARILVREPRPEMLPLHFSYQKLGDGSDEPMLEAGILYALENSTDYTYPFTLANLEPSTRYRYSLSNELSGEFTTAPAPGSPDAQRLSFLSSSCIKPNFPYNPLRHPLRIPGLETLSRAMSKMPSIARPAFMLFLGDFIYIDVPMRFGSSVEHYRNEYHKVYSSPSWHGPPVPPANIPWIHILDDHEIENDWASGNATAPFQAAIDPYLHYHVAVNPPIPEESFSIPANTTYFSFTNGPASFFLLDTRTYRSEPSMDNSTMLGSAQLQSLLAYISRPEPQGVKWKIITSSVPFTKNWHVGTPDTWGGFLGERQTILEAMWKAERDLGVRIVLLSGDRHEFGATRFPDPALASAPDFPETFRGSGRGIHEFCVGPLSQFYLPIRSYKQDDNEDVAIKYVPKGNFKFGAINIDVEGEGELQSSVLTYSLYVDGEIVWKYSLSVPLEQIQEGNLLPPGEVLLDLIDERGILERYLGRASIILDWVGSPVKALLQKERADEA